jgi:penicillin-binding protein 1A
MGFGGGAMVLGIGLLQLESSLPDSVEDVLTYAPPETLTIQAVDGTVLQEVGQVTHEKTKIWQIPDLVSKAFIASEDRRFQEHRGIDFQGIARAVFSNLTSGKVVEGGSTITQQVSRIVFLNQERSFGRKYKEMRIAKKIEDRFDKKQILERYLNLVYLGAGAYGVADAAWVYFSKPLEQLTLAEAATLAAIVPAPSVYSPLENLEAAQERRNLVLKKMQAQGLISPQEAEAAIASPLKVNPSRPKRLQRKAAYFTSYVKKELPKLVSPEALKAGGLVVETTLNPRWQKAAEDTINTTVERYGKWQDFEQGALVAIDPRNGQIRAMVGGVDFEKNQFNRVTQAKRQPGSTFKGFVYATAIAAGISPYKNYLDAEYVVDGYKPENFGDSYSGGYVSMQNAIAKSLNVVAVQILVNVGWNPIINLAQKMGIESKLQPTYSLALGASEVNLLELTSAYGTFANQGIHQKPYGISRVVDRNGKVLYQANYQPEAAIDPNTASIMTWMLQGVVNNGTGIPAQIGRPAAGKTGTSDKARDLWFVGYVPQIVTGVWLGNDDNKQTWGASSMAAVIWRQFMLEAVEGMEIQTFPELPQIEGRKNTIKAEPIKPKRSYYNYTTVRTTSSSGNSQTVRTYSNYTTTPRRRRRSSVTYTQPTRTYTPRRQAAPANNSTRRTAPIRVQPAPAPAPAPAPPVAAPPVPARDFTPPAPPASRKDD